MSLRISETPNTALPDMQPVREVMDINVPNIIEGLPSRNGGIWALCGSGGSGKTSLLLSLFKSKKLYRGKFNNVFYICPSSSFSSVEKHPFQHHDKVHHELTVTLLESIYQQLMQLKEKNVAEDEPVEYNAIIIDDMANVLKQKDIETQLNRMLIKSRHINTMFIFTLQGYYYMPKMLRKQLTNITIFKPKNIEEWNSLTKELFNMSKDNALQLFNYVYDKPYMHIDVDTVNNIYYRNFNRLTLGDESTEAAKAEEKSPTNT